MKKILLAIMTFMMAAPSFAQFHSGGFSLDEENLYWGVRLGVTFGGVSGDIETDEGRTGMTLGGVVGLRVTDNAPLFLESGLYYTERGGDKLKAGNEALGHDAHLNYLEIPALIKYGISMNDEMAILPFLGPCFGIGISGNYKFMKHMEMGLKLGCGLEWNNLYAELLYHFGITDIADPDQFSSHGHALGINFGINF